MHEWMADNGFTPHLVVDATYSGVRIPEGQVSDGKIVLNVSHSATRELVLGNDVITFQARFGGVPRHLEIPIGAVLGIYARETGQGMVFGEDGGAAPPDPSGPPDPDVPPEPDAPPSEGTARRPKLSIVK
jgi:stringent starvation protein B